MSNEQRGRTGNVSAVFAKGTRDVFLIICGSLLFLTTPSSIAVSGIQGYVAMAWAGMIFFGAIVSLFGLLQRRPAWEIIGCSFVGGGFTVWGFTAAVAGFRLPSGDSRELALAVACVFFAGAAGQMYRVISVRDWKI